MKSTTNAYASYTSAAGRVLLSLIFVWSGIGKLAAPAATKAYMAAMGMPLVDLAFIGAVAVEFGLGLALLFGYRTRFAATVLAGFAVVTGFIFHHDFGDMNQMINFMKNVAMAGGLLQISAFGGDSFSLDALRSKQRLATA